MIDPKFLLDQSEAVAENNRRRGKQIDLSKAQGLLKQRSETLSLLEQERSRANDIARKIPSVSAEDRPALIGEGKALKDRVKAIELQLAEAEKELETELYKYPNILRLDVPEGKDETSNAVLKIVGEPTRFVFEPKDHLAIGEALGILDMERAAKVSGGRFVYLKGDAVLLELALVQYALSIIVSEGFTPVLPPHMISTDAMRAMGYLDHGGEEEVYHLKNDPLVLIGTSEQAIGPMHMDEMFAREELPKRYVGYSPCYRREAGSYGKDVRGILRIHQFNKLEMFSFTTAEASDEEHERLLALQERIMQGLRLPYRVLKLCSGDTGASSARTYDIETWIPSQDRYRETHSTSNTTDFQTRRLKIRTKTAEGKSELAHALNGTGFADRIIIAILENYQQADGSVVVPDVLRPYMGKDVMHR